MRLGKKEYIFDERTVSLAAFLAPAPELKIPHAFDFDKGRSAFPVSSWGNDQWGDCVMAARANHTVRLERVEHRSTPRIYPPDVIAEYKAECQRQFGAAPSYAGDPNDNGLYVIETLKDWRVGGWEIPLTKTAKKASKQSVAAFGEIRYDDVSEVRAAVYLMHGVQFGLDLPRSAARQLDNGQSWDVPEGNDADSQPGSWGGHCVYVKRYDQNGLWCITWGREVYMTNAFVNKYADECWAVVDDLDSDRVSRYLDVQAMIGHLRDVGATNIG